MRKARVGRILPQIHTLAFLWVATTVDNTKHANFEVTAVSGGLGDSLS
jgi:hypothetical protein